MVKTPTLAFRRGETSSEGQSCVGVDSPAVVMLTALVLGCRNVTLLHYIITVLEEKFPSVLAFSQELQNIPEAAKVK